MGRAASRAWQAFGASVRGPAHEREGRPNQDAWGAWHGRAGSVLVVCDGLGSRPHADVGARAACHVAPRAVRAWAAAPKAPDRTRLALVHSLWRLAVSPYDEAECATTCLLAYAEPEGSLFLAQLGDGLVAARLPSGELRRIPPVDYGFGNVTSGLGIPGALRDWQTTRIAVAPPGTHVVLATDGVADDLDPERVDAFVQYVYDTYAPMRARARSPRCAGELRRWPVPYHQDDKTVALLWRAGAPHG